MPIIQNQSGYDFIQIHMAAQDIVSICFGLGHDSAADIIPISVKYTDSGGNPLYSIDVCQGTDCVYMVHNMVPIIIIICLVI